MACCIDGLSCFPASLYVKTKFKCNLDHILLFILKCLIICLFLIFVHVLVLSFEYLPQGFQDDNFLKIFKNIILYSHTGFNIC